MLGVLDNLLTSGSFIPHGHCYLWRPHLVWLHIVSDALIALAYYSIPITLIYFVRRRSDLPYPWIFLLFGAFIIACGTTHLMEVWTLWHPVYWLSGAIKLITASISLFTAATLLPLVPKALALPSPSQLEAINQELACEIAERQQAEIALKQAHEELEIRVRERTAELHQSEAQNRAILEAIPDLLLRVRSDGSCINCIFPKGSTAEVFIPIYQHLCEVLSPELLQQQLHYIEQALITGQLQVYEHQFIKPNGVAYEELRITAIGENEVLIMVRDITAYKQSEESLRRSENQLRLITDALPVLVAYVNAQQCYVFNNQAYEQWFGHARTEITGRHIRQVLGESTYQSVEPYVKMALAGQKVTYESIIPYQDGETRYVQATYLPHFGESGEVKGFIALVNDLNERKQLEDNLYQAKEELERRVEERTKQLLKTNKALQQSEARYRAIVEDQTELIARFSADGQLSFVNEAYCRYFEVTKEAVVGNHYEPVIFEEDRERVTRLVNLMNWANPVVMIENRVIVSGQVRWTQWINRALFDLSGNFIEFQSVGRDITERKQTEAALQKTYEELEFRVAERTQDLAQANQELQMEIVERKRAEEALRKSEQRLSLAIEGAGMATWDYDLRTEKILWSAQHFKLLGYAPIPSGEATLEMWRSRVHADDLERVEEALKQAEQQRSLYSPVHRIIRVDNGQIIWLAVFGRFLYDDRGQAVRFIGIFFDATETKRAEEQIKASLQEKEVLLQEIHHRVKNNLQVICSLLNLQSKDIKDESALEILKESQNRIRSMALIHEKLYQSPDLSKIDFTEYIRHLATNLFRSYRINTNTITLKTYINENIYLDVDAAVNCGLIVNELLSNSLKYAFPQASSGEIFVKIQPQKEALALTIGDNGIGLPANFNIKNAKTLGLKLVNSLIAQLRGNMEINTSPQGTEFKITFTGLK